ncbi:thymidine kinase [Fusibacter tunisiensis]|uniref:Thymidine kinase n=1 Tax=Fusibacter tunisiensis TaxID=1008308 RepID=A0ABS2MPF9_9FIRM|nr:thymidine kinase [Fusibacter tunisiensis]MBM7561285.1 thymidine kinase [Fusibacter tunisiensis]
MAKLYFRYGAMNCGKSTALMQVVHNYHERGMRAMVIKPYTDTKGGDQIVSRLGIVRKADLIIKSDESVKAMLDDWRVRHGEVNCIMVDEAQFFKASQIDEFFEIAVKRNVPVICYGLRTDFSTRGFEGSERLLLLAHSLEELKTICRCGRKAVLNGRKVNGKFVFEGEQVAIDGEDQVEYESLCANCYFELKEKEKNHE